MDNSYDCLMAVMVALLIVAKLVQPRLQLKSNFIPWNGMILILG